MDADRFEAIYREHVGSVYRYCLFRAGSHAHAEDLTAEAFARLLASDGRAGDQRALPWLLKVARNFGVDEARRSRQFAFGIVPERAVPFPDGEIWVDTDVREAMLRLPRLEQQVVFLRLIEDRPFADVAAAIGRGEGSARVLYGRALKRLRARLQRGDE